MTAPFRTPQDYAGFWPFGWLSFYTDMAHDFGRYAQTLTECTDAMEAMRAEGVLALGLWDDMARAYADLAARPWAMMAAGLAEQANRIDGGIGPAALMRIPGEVGDGLSPARRGPAAR